MKTFKNYIKESAISESMDAGDYLNPKWGLHKAVDNKYYVLQHDTHKVKHGPFDSADEAEIARKTKVDFKDDHYVAKYSSAAHDFVK